VEKPDHWPDPELENPEQFADSVKEIRNILNLLGSLQMEMSLAIIQDPRSKELNQKWQKASEQKMMDLMDNAVKHFVGALPVATANGVNLFASVISCHSSLTGDPLVRKIIEKINEEVMSNQD